MRPALIITVYGLKIGEDIWVVHAFNKEIEDGYQNSQGKY